MALPLPSTVLASERAVRRGMERYVLALLHRARKPEALAATPLMEAICLATGIAQPVAALEHVVRRALAGEDRTATTRRDAVVEVDFHGVLTNRELAAQKGISRRHFQRRRAKAVAAIAQYATGLLGSARLAESEPHRQTQWRFDREAAAYVRARRVGIAPEMRCIAASLARLAGTRASRDFARRSMAAANVRLGRVDEALEGLRDLSPSDAVLLRAELALLNGCPEEAEDYGRLALGELDEAERYRGHAVISQARFVRGVAWRPPREAASLPWNSWERIAMEVERARHLALQEWRSEAEVVARRAYRRAEELGYHALATRSAATICAVAAARSASVPARWWRARAIEHLLPTQDRLLATGLFCQPADDARLGLDRLLCDVLYRRLCLIVPQVLGDDEERRAAVCGLLAEIFAFSPQGALRSRALDAAIASVAGSGSAFADYAQACVEPLAEMLALARIAVTGSSWGEVFASLRETVARCAHALRPAAPRAIPIAVPQPRQSRLARIDHLRHDEERAGADGCSLEGLADLCLRFVPFRSDAGDALSRSGGHSVTGTSRAVAGLADSR